MIILGYHVTMIIKEKEINRDTLNSKFSTNLSLFLISLLEELDAIYLIMSHQSDVDLIDFKCDEDAKIFWCKMQSKQSKDISL